MKKRRNEILFGLIGVVGTVVCVGGILMFLNMTDPVEVTDDSCETETMEVAVQEIKPVIPVATEKPVEVSVPEISTEKAEILVAEKSSEEQTIQEIPEQPEVPDEKPELKEGEDLENPDKVPEYVEQPKPTEKPADTVVQKKKEDNSHPGAIYVEGFGWVEYSGPNHGEYAPDIYENGNKIGDM